MKQSLQLKLGQQLTMTPQLQQAIRLLQLSTLDLQQEIQEALESNPMLETAEDDFDGEPEAPKNNTEVTVKELNENWDDKIPDDLAVDTQWDDIYQNPVSSAPATSEDYDFDNFNTVTETLQDHLMWQLNLTPMSEVDRLIATTIIDAIDDSGFLTLSAEEIHDSLQGDPQLDIEMDEVMAVLHRLQHFDPPGVAAHDLRECLLIQLRQMPPETASLKDAILVVDKFINLLGNHDYAQLLRRTKLKEPELKEAIELIQTLNPRPGDIIDSSHAEYVIPDVFVSKVGRQWRVELNPDVAPKLRINNGYADLVRRADNSTDNNFLRDSLQEARWFLKSLQSRNETLMKVATAIVERQIDFFEHGEEAMKPMVLNDIAETVDMHESTISRVTTQKYMHTPRGVFELKYFFSSHVGTSSGGECSSTAIRAIIKKLVAAENPRKPLSDSKITQLLQEQGIEVARRTIAKYRESLNIPPSNERKRLT
ncbi:MAG TPA: RNA polymerase factor sigma-54 [Pseudomonadales bacterium]|nr:RNA polymerase factor sigma-54 [Pseudomonadales bacterium]